MNRICPPSNYTLVSFTIERKRPGTFTLWEYHRHEGETSYCAGSDQYPRLAWDELLDLLVVLADSRRPGMHPEGWTQEELDL